MQDNNKIMLIDIDSTIPNLALKKIEKYHQDKGDEVIWDFPLMAHQVDKIYVSCIFEKNKSKCEQWEQWGATIGGSGYDIKGKLPDEIENVKPKINLGFTTRGCIRNCEFCIVPQKEGKIRAVGDLLDLWDGKAKDVVLLDNNILALPKHFKLICKQARENKIRLDFNQGLDHRLLTEENVKELKSIRHIEYRFSFDRLKSFNTVDKAITMLTEANLKRCMWFCLVGFDTTFEEDLERFNYLKSRNQNGYCMRYNGKTDKKYTALARWVNQHHIFQGMTFEEFCKRNKYYDLIKEQDV